MPLGRRTAQASIYISNKLNCLTLARDLRDIQGMTLGKRIIEARQARGWTQKTLADTLGRCSVMSQQALSQLESGKTHSTRYLWELAALLGVSPRWLGTGEGTMQDDDAKSRMPLPPASDTLQPLLAKLYELDRAGELPAPVVEGLIRLLDGVKSTNTSRT